LIIWGLRVCYFGRVSQGVFHCSECGGDRNYSHKIGRRWFTASFIPVIPLNVVAEAVQCGTCNTRYAMNVLNVPTSRQLELAYPVAVSAAVSLVMRAAGTGRALAGARAVDAVRLAGGEAYSQAALHEEMDQPARTVHQRLAAAGGCLAPEARERVLAEATLVALADAPLTGEERSVLATIGQTLNLTAAQSHGVINIVEQSGAHP
jgi:hypothetical protein